MYCQLSIYHILMRIKANNGVFSNLRNVNTRLPPESNGACASRHFVAVPLSGPAGVIGIYDVDEPGRLPDGVMDGVFNKAQVTDLQWNPFDDEQLAVGTDSGVINLWRLTRADGPRNEMQPEKQIKISGEKIVILRWHPLASDLLAVALSDFTLQLWNVREQTLLHTIPSHRGGILAMAWSANGRRLATLGKDFKLSVHNLNNPLGQPMYERAGVLESPRAARVFFACDDRMIVVVGLTKGSNRQVQLYDATTTDLRSIYQQTIDNATQPLIPHYDYDTNIIFLAGKGDRTINMFELTYDSPYLLPLSNFTAPMGSQAIAYHNKKTCNVMAVEFQVAWRLTEKTLERLIFRVPRVKKDLFQSDLFPDALVTWRAVMTPEEWLAQSDKEPEFESLKPEGVQHLASHTANNTASSSTQANGTIGTNGTNGSPAQATTIPQGSLPSPQPRTTTIKPPTFPAEPALKNTNGELEPDKKEIEQSWSSKIMKDTKLEQDDMDGCEEAEWTEL
ncbi:hypothetical protein WR25_08397 [Diploscapter pachys]|uniref:Coronin-7 n=1 Tax=Diploscapter pachys TaxID=2018661 RepID=A0A2A2JPH7_9BILA|nr:hypothetical protein WR25_08397 [Diploscapter pachys]